MTSNSKLYDKIVLKNSQSLSAGAHAPKTFKGFSTISPDSNNFKLYDYALIKQDVINHFHIRKGEKLENPGFGTIIWDMLFEPMTEYTQQMIAQDVEAVIRSDPRVIPNKIIVSQYDSGLRIDCSITILPYNITETMQLTFDRENGLLSSG
jgi:phage baseplate assembly protein W